MNRFLCQIELFLNYCKKQNYAYKRGLFTSLLNFTSLLKMEIEKITLELEDLKPPPYLLKINTLESIQSKYSDACCSSIKNDLVLNSQHPVLDGFVRAFIDHRPVTISSDIIWLLIVQGFSYHVEYNAEELRSKFVNFQGKQTLTVETDIIDISNPLKWEDIFSGFISKISEYTGKELTQALTPNFSTTTTTSYSAGLISIMASMKKYFGYEGRMVGCGIPSVTIEGTLQDWEQIQEKLKVIEKYDLEWWVSKLHPIIEEIINTKKGNANKDFWLHMVRYKDGSGLYDPSYIDGWICSFYPYNKKGQRNSLNKIYDQNKLPPEVLQVPMKLTIIYPGKPDEKYNCTIYSGFFGLTQDLKTLNLKPEIGWIMTKQPLNDNENNGTNF
ncbi:hypothetical protein TRFO_15924 [Tritrichomonas foetus]|uniref:DUF4419 domain-containing protein n=1 Tax=Tritrichomonas foetus TaxID=1144522 RepID=A0A1J4KRT5_9EUKA|nr:hypothetical protein TRFO_15924 [Tritrichomonas foetus]|eukprot:OHT13810.1 hypothetical protein TRFO_15924 [Tritrichomonas foetus]